MCVDAAVTEELINVTLGPKTSPDILLLSSALLYDLLH